MMYTKRLALIAVLHGMQCAAQMDNSYPMSGTNGTAPYEGSSTFLKAAQSPNASHTVSFAHYYDNSMAAISTDPKLNNWTWTVKVSEAQLPNISAYHPNLTHVAYTTYELSWPEQGGLNSALAAEAKAGNNGAGYPSCAYLVTAQFPEDISKKWDGSSNCTSALGANCTETLTKMLSSGSSCEVGFALDNPDFIAACKSSFGSTEGDGWGIKPFSEFSSTFIVDSTNAEQCLEARTIPAQAQCRLEKTKPLHII